MANKGAQSATTQLTSVPLGDWSRTECLYIQLQSELLLAVACLPAAPQHSIDDASQYIGYCKYFADTDAETEDSPDEAGSGVVKGIKPFFDKRGKLSGHTMWALRQMSLDAINNNDGPSFDSVHVSPAMLQNYRQIRERLGFDTYMYDPMLWPELWSFLQDAARSQFPEFSGDTTQAELTQDFDANADVGVDVGPASAAGPVPANDRVATSDHDSTGEDEMSDIDNDETSDADNDANSGEARLGPDDFAKETGNPRCTAYNTQGPNIGKRCTRKTKDRTVDRRTWECHIHDPEQQRKIQADRLRRNAAKKRNEGGK
jgi:hypothetical protein